MQRILTDHVIGHGLLAEAEKKNLVLLAGIANEAAERARQICHAGEFTSAITLLAIEACMNDAAWLQAYA